MRENAFNPVKIDHLPAHSSVIDTSSIGGIVRCTYPGGYTRLPFARKVFNGRTITILAQEALTVLPPMDPQGNQQHIRSGSGHVSSIAMPAGTTLCLVWDGVWTAILSSNSTAAVVTSGVVQSLGASGFRVFEEGLILQWGAVFCPSDGHARYNFPTPFTQECFQVVGSGSTSYVQEGIAQAGFCFIDLTALAFTVTNDGINQHARFFALGR